MKTVRKPSDETIAKSQFRLIPNDPTKAKSTYRSSEKFTLIFDLDETLVHVSNDGRPADAYIPIKFQDGKKIEVLLINQARDPCATFHERFAPKVQADL